MAQSTRWWKHLLQSNKRIAPAVKIEIPPLSHVEIKIKILTIVLPVFPIGGIKMSISLVPISQWLLVIFKDYYKSSQEKLRTRGALERSHCWGALALCRNQSNASETLIKSSESFSASSLLDSGLIIRE